jgi:predicted HAD superfamily hydrolase
LRINLFENENLAKVHHPEFKLVTNDIEEVYKRLLSSHPQFLHPNLREVTLHPWGAKEFALMNKQLGTIIQQW